MHFLKKFDSVFVKRFIVADNGFLMHLTYVEHICVRVDMQTTIIKSTVTYMMNTWKKL